MRHILRQAIALIVGGDDDAMAHVVSLSAGCVGGVLAVWKGEQQGLLLRKALVCRWAFIVGCNGDVAVDVQGLDAVGLLTVVGCPCKERR